MSRIVVVAIVLASLAAQVSAHQAETEEPKSRTVSVRGAGTVSAMPDQVRVTIQVSTRAESATAAMASANARTKEILMLVKGVGVDPKDVQTSRVTV